MHLQSKLDYEMYKKFGGLCEKLRKADLKRQMCHFPEKTAICKENIKKIALILL